MYNNVCFLWRYKNFFFLLIPFYLELCNLYHFHHIIWEMRKILMMHIMIDLCSKKVIRINKKMKC